MKRFMLPLVLAIHAPTAISQTDAKGEWTFPTNMRSMCVDIEQRIVRSYKDMVVQNRLGIAANTQEEKRNYFELGSAFKQSMETDQKAWEQLGCAGILYPKK